MSDNKIAQPGLYNATGNFSIPAAIQAPGTITTVGTRVYGSATTFTKYSLIRPGDWIYDPYNNQVRQVRSIASDTLLYIDSGFTVDIVGPNLWYVIRAAQYREISVLNPTSNTSVTVDKGTLVAGASVDYQNEAGLDPITCSCGGNTVEIAFKK